MCFIAVASHLHYVRPFWKLYLHNGGDLSALGLIFNPRWLKHPSAWLNIDRAIQLVREEVEEWGAHPARSDGSEEAGISSRSDEYLNGGLMCNVARDALQLPVPRKRPSVSPTDGSLAPQRCIASRWHPATSEERVSHFVPRRRVTRAAPTDGNPGWLRGRDSRPRPRSAFRKLWEKSSLLRLFEEKVIGYSCAA